MSISGILYLLQYMLTKGIDLAGRPESVEAFAFQAQSNCFHWVKYVVYVSFIDIRPFKWNMYGTDESVGVSATSDFSLLVQVVSYMRTG